MTKYPFNKVKPLKPLFIPSDNTASARQLAYQYAQRNKKTWKVAVVPGQGIIVTEIK